MADLLTNISAPQVDGHAVRRQASPVIMNNIVQGLQQSDGRGVTEQFSVDPTATEIRITRVVPLTGEARQVGNFIGSHPADTNYGYFNDELPESPATENYPLRVIQVYDQMIDIPETLQQMFSPATVTKTFRNLAQKISININASTLAEQILKSLKGGVPPHVYTLGTLTPLNILADVSVALDDGDKSQGQDVFSEMGRITMVRPAFKSELLKSDRTVFSVGNYKAQDMLSMGAVSPGVTPNTIENGYFGDLYNIPFCMTSSTIFSLAEKYLGLAPGALNDIHSVTTHAIGTGRAIAFTSQMKVIDCPRGQGIRLQPLYRWGHESWFPKSIQIVAETDLAGLIASLPNQILAPGSRT